MVKRAITFTIVITVIKKSNANNNQALLVTLISSNYLHTLSHLQKLKVTNSSCNRDSVLLRLSVQLRKFTITYRFRVFSVLR